MASPLCIIPLRGTYQLELICRFDIAKFTVSMRVPTPSLLRHGLDAIATGDVAQNSLPRGRQSMLAVLFMFIASLAAQRHALAGEPAAAASDNAAHHGKLVICGGGALPIQLRGRFIELAGGPNARVVVVTTASAWADSDKIEGKLGFWRAQHLASLAILHTRSRATADEPEFTRPLLEATGVWFIGGNQNLLTETYLGTLTEREIRGVLARAGVVGGTSAGAAIMSPVMIRRGNADVETGPGFGFLPGTVIDQHFLKRNRQHRLLKVLGTYPDLVGLGIDEGTGVVVDGSHVSVLGESQVVVCSSADGDNPETMQSLAAGAETDMNALRTLAAHVAPKPAAALAAAAPPPTAVAQTPQPAPAAADVAASAEPAEATGLGH